MKNKLVSLVIPVYNEQEVIENCLDSLTKQSYKDLEVILVDDGSTDSTLEIIKNRPPSIVHFLLLEQQHKGPGVARNLGALNAKGDILVFVDADMTFDKNFIKDLVKPILDGKSIGTFSKNEFVRNKTDVWSICWNINRNLPADRMISKSYPDSAPVFRAILKDKFLSVSGFDTDGRYTDDWSLSRKLGIKSSVALGAIYYHENPGSLGEIWKQARWIGKNEFISGTFLRRAKSLILYSLPISILIGFLKTVINIRLLARRSASEVGSFVLFKIVYDLAVWISVAKYFVNESKFK
jgi:glycosyltransferase involved in cell wall biosynthesis